MKIINPATEAIVNTYSAHTDNQIDHIIDAAQQAFIEWRQISVADKAQLFLKLADSLEQNKETYAKLITEEMGKILVEAQLEVEKCAFTCRYYANNIASFLKDEYVEAKFHKSYISYQPLGVILAIMPWNFPFWQVIRFAVPTLLAGNVCILRHALNVIGCALSLTELFVNAGFPKHVIQALVTPHEKVPYVIKHEFIQGVTLTGSTYAGTQVAKKAGEHIKKTVLELGGSDPYIILNDADLDSAVAACVKSRMINAGQTCIAAKRFIIQDKIYDAFVEQFTNKMQGFSCGDPLDPNSNIGPLAHKQLRDNLHKQVSASIRCGAKCLIGGTIPQQPGFYYPPTVMTDVQPGMPAFDEELFGPVASMIKVTSEQEAIKLANQSDYGLGGAVFTQDLAKGEHIARNEIAAGFCVVNGIVASDPRLPFGGIKQSGYGRELGLFGVRAFTNVKTVVVNK